MHPVKLVIPGRYYDSLIYSGRLYLWQIDGTIVVVNWDRLLDGIAVSPELDVVLRCAFQKSELLYGDDARILLHDPEIKGLIVAKFERLASLDIEVKLEDNRQSIVTRRENRLPFPHADSEVYSQTLYIGSQDGVSALELDKGTKSELHGHIDRIWDAPVLDIAAAYGTLCMAAGSEGLFELFLGSDYIIDDWALHHASRTARQLSAGASNAVHWLYHSVFSSSYNGSGFLADFSLTDADNSSETKIRRLREVIPSNNIFGEASPRQGGKYSWGAHDKICLATGEGIDIVRYDPYKRTGTGKFTELGHVNMNGHRPGEIVNAASALFGYIVEEGAGLSVITSILEYTWLRGEPVNWRVFPNSRFYENHLHVVYEDHLCIYSFNDDYFADQRTKQVGMRQKSGMRRWR
jgi:hypothetical protein